MSRMIPNENSWVGWSTTAPVDPASPTEDEILAAKTLTKYIVSINPTSQGNAIPAPALDSLFDRSAIGTSQGSFSGDFYRDDEPDPVEAIVDFAWHTLPRGTKGYLYVSRFGGSGPLHQPLAGQTVEVWRIGITQRAGSNMTSNTLQTFSSTGAILDPPHEDAIVAAGATPQAPSAPFNLVATPGATGIVELDWEVPTSNGGHPITGYKVYKSTVAGGAGAYTEVTTNITKIGSTAALTSVAAGATYFKVAATNSAGDSVQSAFATCTVA